MENLFDWGGEQMMIYLGRELGDLVTITLNKYALIYKRCAKLNMHETVPLKQR